MDEAIKLPIGEMNELFYGPGIGLKAGYETESVWSIDEVDDGQPLGWDEEQ